MKINKTAPSKYIMEHQPEINAALPGGKVSRETLIKQKDEKATARYKKIEVIKTKLMGEEMPARVERMVRLEPRGRMMREVYAARVAPKFDN